jgi:hypothetical protein
MIYRTWLINFGYSTYEGPLLSAAKTAAEKNGFEAVIFADQQSIASWSPVSGWKNLT